MLWPLGDVHSSETLCNLTQKLRNNKKYLIEIPLGGPKNVMDFAISTFAVLSYYFSIHNERVLNLKILDFSVFKLLAWLIYPLGSINWLCLKTRSYANFCICTCFFLVYA